jgi:glycosyltransferase involved in cell wall biosynthesis
MAGRLTFVEAWLAEIPEEKVEVFLVHDVQDENTSDELRSLILKQNNPNIFFSEGIFGTAGQARNSVLNLCNGQWIAFWDSDDVPNLANILKAIDISFDVIIGEFLVQGLNGEHEINRHGDNYKHSLTRLSFQPGIWRILFKKEVITAIRFPSFKMGEDQDFLAQIKWDKAKVKFDSSTFYTYNLGHEFQTTAKVNSRASLIDSLRFLSNLIESDLGTETFIRNLASRQFLTVVKDSNFKLKVSGIITFLIYFKTLKGGLKQIASLVALFSYLARRN